MVDDIFCKQRKFKFDKVTKCSKFPVLDVSGSFNIWHQNLVTHDRCITFKTTAVNGNLNEL